MTNFSEKASSADCQTYIDALFGGLLPNADCVSVHLAHSLRRPRSLLQSWQIEVGQPGWLRWSLSLEWPETQDGTWLSPVLLSPDACWPHCLDTAARDEVLQAGVALASFNRLDIAHDSPAGERTGAVFEHWPDGRFGAISAWAWGISRSVDALLQIGFDAGALGVVGHSRSGKAALLAAAIDERIALTVAHNSGTAGAASFQLQGPQAETLQQLQQAFPHWLGKDTGQAHAQQHIAALDSPTLLQAIWPRRLCILQANDDLWANPAGTRHAFETLVAQQNAADLRHNTTLIERAGGHAMTSRDWQRAASQLRKLAMDRCQDELHGVPRGFSPTSPARNTHPESGLWPARCGPIPAQPVP